MIAYVVLYVDYGDTSIEGVFGSFEEALGQVRGRPAEHLRHTYIYSYDLSTGDKLESQRGFELLGEVEQ